MHTYPTLALDFVPAAFAVAGVAVLIIGTGILFWFASFFRKVQQGTALVCSGIKTRHVTFTGMMVYPIVHKAELMDIKVKRLEIERRGTEGLVCKDNLRADINVAFFVRVNDNEPDVLRVATTIGCDRASNVKEIEQLFDAKFSEALKTVGKQFDFVQLYEERDRFRDEILKVIGTDLNGFVLDDCAIDFLEMTPLESMNPNNILDAVGIKKITELTAAQAMLANGIQRDKERVIKKQNVEAAEAILELERQQAEATAKQKREISIVQAREEAESERVKHEEWQRAQQARILAEEEILVAEQNKERSIIVAQRNKERTDAVEIERVERDRKLEEIERDRVTSLKGIERDKAVETEKRDIQEVIKQRVEVERTVVEEQQKIKDTEAFATAERDKKVAITAAEQRAQEELVKKIKEAEAAQQAAKLQADQHMYTRVKDAEAAKAAAMLQAEEIVVKAEAEETASEKQSEAKKLMADAARAEAAAVGLGEAEVVRAKGEAQATSIRAQGEAEAQTINAKAEAMKLFDTVGRDHEEFKLRLEKEKQIELAEISTQRDIAESQAVVLGEALKSAKIDIVGGDGEFFDRISKSIVQGKSVDRLVHNSETLSDIKETFFNSDPEYFKAQVKGLMDQFGMTSDDLKNLSIAALLGQMISASGENGLRTRLQGLLGAAKRFGVAEKRADEVFVASNS